MIATSPLDSWIQADISKPGEPLNLERLRRFQLARLKETLAYAKAHSLFYRDHLKGFGPSDLGGLRDLESLPFTCSDDISRDPLRFLCVSQSHVQRVITLKSSGTTGAPKRLFFTAADLDRTRAFFGQAMSAFVSPGEKVLILLPGGDAESVGELLKAGLNQIGVESLVAGPVRDPEAVIRRIQKLDIACLVGIPVQVLGLARHRMGKCLGKGQIRSVVLSTDNLPESLATALADIWGCRVFNHYGMSEMGYGGGVECGARAGYHFREADLYLEVVDPESGAVRPPGKPGEIVFTTLNREAMPLIRYRTGDLSCWIADGCVCGSALPRMEIVRGRRLHRIALANKKTLCMADLDEALFPLDPVCDYEARIGKKQGKMALEIRLCLGEDSPGLVPAAKKRLLALSPLKGLAETGELAIHVDCQARAGPPSSGQAKRRIKAFDRLPDNDSWQGEREAGLLSSPVNDR